MDMTEDFKNRDTFIHWFFIFAGPFGIAATLLILLGDYMYTCIYDKPTKKE